MQNFTNHCFTLKYHSSSDVLEEFYRRQKLKPLKYKLPVDETTYTSENFLIRTTLKPFYLPICKVQCKNENVLEPLRSSASHKSVVPIRYNQESEGYAFPIDPENYDEEAPCKESLNFIRTNINDSFINYEIDIVNQHPQGENNEDEVCNVIVDGIIEYHQLNSVHRTDHIVNLNGMEKSSNDIVESNLYYSQEEVMEIENILHELREDKTLDSFVKTFNGPEKKLIQKYAPIEETRVIPKKLPDSVNNKNTLKNYSNSAEHGKAVVNQIITNLNQDTSICWSRQEGTYKHREQPSEFNIEKNYVDVDLKENPTALGKPIFPTQKTMPSPRSTMTACINTYQYEPFLGNIACKTQLSSEQTKQSSLNFAPLTFSLGEELKDSLEVMYGNELCVENPTNTTPAWDSCVNVPVLNENLYHQSSWYPSSPETGAIISELCDPNPNENVPSYGTDLMSTWTFNIDRIPEFPHGISYLENYKSKNNTPSTHRNNNGNIETSRIATPFYSQALLDSAKQLYIQSQRHLFLSRNRKVNYPLSTLKENLEVSWKKLPFGGKEKFIKQAKASASFKNSNGIQSQDNLSNESQEVIQYEEIHTPSAHPTINSNCASANSDIETNNASNKCYNTQYKRSLSLSPQPFSKKKRHRRTKAEMQALKASDFQTSALQIVEEYWLTSGTRTKKETN